MQEAVNILARYRRDFSEPKSGLMWRETLPLSVRSVDAFFAAPLRVSKRPASASAR